MQDASQTLEDVVRERDALRKERDAYRAEFETLYKQFINMRAAMHIAQAALSDATG
jgi:uncharacterized coiled-coil DUF342 family protein